MQSMNSRAGFSKSHVLLHILDTATLCIRYKDRRACLLLGSAQLGCGVLLGLRLGLAGLLPIHWVCCQQVHILHGLCILFSYNLQHLSAWTAGQVQVALDDVIWV